MRYFWHNSMIPQSRIARFCIWFAQWIDGVQWRYRVIHADFDNVRLEEYFIRRGEE